jgi:O-antigen ligase
LLAIGLTLSRGGMVGAIPALLFCWLKSRNKAVGLGLGAAALAGALVFAPADLKSEFVSIADTDAGTAGTRRYFWDLSVQMFQEKPIFGVGASCWGNALYSGLIDEPSRRAHMTPHSVYFQVLTELGLFGTFCFMGLLAAAALGLRELRAARLDADAGRILAAAAEADPSVLRKLRADLVFMRNFVPCLAIGIIGFLVCGAFLSVLYYPGLPLFAALVQAAREAWKTETALAAAVCGVGPLGNLRDTEEGARGPDHRGETGGPRLAFPRHLRPARTERP